MVEHVLGVKELKELETRVSGATPYSAEIGTVYKTGILFLNNGTNVLHLDLGIRGNLNLKANPTIQNLIENVYKKPILNGGFWMQDLRGCDCHVIKDSYGSIIALQNLSADGGLFLVADNQNWVDPVAE